jgi:hypothetical protein
MSSQFDTATFFSMKTNTACFTAMQDIIAHEFHRRGSPAREEALSSFIPEQIKSIRTRTPKSAHMDDGLISPTQSYLQTAESDCHEFVFTDTYRKNLKIKGMVPNSHLL